MAELSNSGQFFQLDLRAFLQEDPDTLHRHEDSLIQELERRAALSISTGDKDNEDAGTY